VTPYLLAGLGDTVDELVAGCDSSHQIGVYPFVVPFVPIAGTPLEHHPAPSSEMMFSLYQRSPCNVESIRDVFKRHQKLATVNIGACSAISSFGVIVNLKNKGH
jgi:biotin synthase-related radical SAM superfamily protein